MPLVVLCVVVAVGLAVAYSLHTQKKYTATAAVVFNNTPLSAAIAGLQAPVNTQQQSQQDTNAQLLQLGDLSQQTASQVGHGLTTGAVANSLSISPVGDTTVVRVGSTLPSAPLAAQVANAYTKIFVNEQQNANRSYYSSALATVERQLTHLSRRQAAGAQGLALQNRAQSLGTLAQLRNDTVRLGQAAAVPTSPSSPRITRDVIIAGLLGLVLGVILALGFERIDQRIREPEELERSYGLPLLGAVPETAALRSGARRSRNELTPAVANAFQFIHARLRYFNLDRDVRTLAVVSAVPADGKTTIAHWLAEAGAAMGSQVLLIEADLRRPTLAGRLDSVRSEPGLADCLIGSRTFDDVTQRVPLATSGASRPMRERGFDVIVAGALPPNPAEMLESHAMTMLLEQARSSYEFVVIDTSPIGAVSDALPLLGKVDGVVVVGSIDRSRRAVIKRVRATLTSVTAPLLGTIANRVKARGSALDGYGYGYGYGSDKTPEMEFGDGGAENPDDGAADWSQEAVQAESLAGRGRNGQPGTESPDYIEPPLADQESAATGSEPPDTDTEAAAMLRTSAGPAESGSEQAAFMTSSVADAASPGSQQDGDWVRPAPPPSRHGGGTVFERLARRRRAAKRRKRS